MTTNPPRIPTRSRTDRPPADEPAESRAALQSRLSALTTRISLGRAMHGRVGQLLPAARHHAVHGRLRARDGAVVVVGRVAQRHRQLLLALLVAGRVRPRRPAADVRWSRACRAGSGRSRSGSSSAPPASCSCSCWSPRSAWRSAATATGCGSARSPCSRRRRSSSPWSSGSASCSRARRDLLDHWKHVVDPRRADRRRRDPARASLGGDLGTTVIMAAIVLGALFFAGRARCATSPSARSWSASSACFVADLQRQPARSHRRALRRGERRQPGRQLADRQRLLRARVRRRLRRRPRQLALQVVVAARRRHRLHLRHHRRGARPDRRDRRARSCSCCWPSCSCASSTRRPTRSPGSRRRRSWSG